MTKTTTTKTKMTTTKTMTIDPSFGPHRWRPRLLGAAIALAVVSSACSSGGEAATTATAETAPNTSTATTASTSIANSSPDPVELLGKAIDEHRAGYEFVATTTVNDQEATVQTGRWLAGSSQIAIKSGAGEVEYIITDEGHWTRLPDGEWERLDDASITTFPLEPMAAPESISLVAADGNSATLRAIYPATALGLSGESVEVLLDFRDEKLVGITFTADIEGNRTESVTSLAPLSDSTPITAPSDQ